MMEIEIEFGAKRKAVLIAPIVVITLIILTLLGRAVTPVEAGKAQLLTPSRWAEMKERRAVEHERNALCSIALELKGEIGRADPVRAERLLRRVEARPELPLIAAQREALLEAAQAHLEFALGLRESDEAAEQGLRKLLHRLGCGSAGGDSQGPLEK